MTGSGFHGPRRDVGHGDRRRPLWTPGGLGTPALDCENFRMRLPSSAHYSRPWRIHELTPDFQLEDVWALPTPGGPDDFPRLVALLAARDPERDSTGITGLLMAVRLRLGRLLGWDDADTGLGTRVPSLRTGCRRTCARSRSRTRSRSSPSTGSTTKPRRRSPTGRCTASCTSAGCRTGPAATVVRWPSWSNGTGCSGRCYLAAIKPIRHLIVYPAMLRRIERSWRDSAEHAPVGRGGAWRPALHAVRRGGRPRPRSGGRGRRQLPAMARLRPAVAPRSRASLAAPPVDRSRLRRRSGSRHGLLL